MQSGIMNDGDDLSQLLEFAHDELGKERFDSSIHLFKQALQGALNRNDRRLEGYSLIGLAQAIRIFEHVLPEGTTPFQFRETCGIQALQIFRELGDHSGIAQSLLVIATNKNPVEAVSLLEIALDHAVQCNCPKTASHILTHLGNHAALAHEVKKAQQFLDDALTFARKSGCSECLVKVLQVYVLHFHGKNVDRRKLFDELIGRCKSLEWNAKAGHFSLWCAILACDSNEIELREQYLRFALAMAKAHDDRAFEYQALNRLAELCRDCGDEQRAQEFDKEATVVRRSTNEISTEVQAALANMDFEQLKSALTRGAKGDSHYEINMK